MAELTRDLLKSETPEYAQEFLITLRSVADHLETRYEPPSCACGGVPRNPYPGWEDEQ